RRHPELEAPGRDDEQVHGVGEEREPDDHLEGARPEDQVDPRRRHHADAYGQQKLHQRPSPSWSSASKSPSVPASASTSWCAGCGTGSSPFPPDRRIDWCASAMSISTVAPITRKNTPRSNRVADTRCTSPSSGRST